MLFYMQKNILFIEIFEIFLLFYMQKKNVFLKILFFYIPKIYQFSHIFVLFNTEKTRIFKKMKYLGRVIKYISSLSLPSPPKVMLPRFSESSAISSGLFSWCYKFIAFDFSSIRVPVF